MHDENSEDSLADSLVDKRLVLLTVQFLVSSSCDSFGGLNRNLEGPEILEELSLIEIAESLIPLWVLIVHGSEILSVYSYMGDRSVLLSASGAESFAGPSCNKLGR